MEGKKNKKTANTLVAPLLFIIMILAVVLMVTIPELVLTPLSWLLNSEVTYDSFKHSYKPGQSATYFQYYIHDSGDIYLGLPLFSSIALATFALYIVILPVVIVLLKEKNNPRYILTTFKVPILAFLVCVGFFFAANQDGSGTIKKAITFNFGVGDSIYKGSYLTSSNNGSTYWHTFVTNDTPNHYRKVGSDFKLHQTYTLHVRSSMSGSNIEDFSFASDFLPNVRSYGKHLVIVTHSEFLILDASNNKKVLLEDIASPDFTLIEPLQILFNDRSNTLNITNAHLDRTIINIGNLLDQEPQNNTRNRLATVPGKASSARQVIKQAGDSRYLSPVFIKPKILAEGTDTIFLHSDGKIGDKSSNIISALNSELNIIWKIQPNEYQPNIDNADHLDCNKYDLHVTNGVLSVTYHNGGRFYVCATEFYDELTGELLAQFEG